MSPGSIRPVTSKPRLYRDKGEWTCLGLRKTGWWIFKTEEPCWAIGKTSKDAYELFLRCFVWVH